MSDLMSSRSTAVSSHRSTSRGAARSAGGRAALRAVGAEDDVSTPATPPAPATSTPTRDWCTPPELIAAVREAFGGTIDLDPCSNEHSLVGAAREYLLPEVDGLAAPWDAEHIFVNPPTGRDLARGTRIADWFARIAEAVDAGSQVIALVPVATNTAAWKTHVYPRATSICFLSASRVKFHLDGREDPKGAPMACAVVYFGPDVEAFEAAFAAHGTCLRVASTIPAPRSAVEALETTAAETPDAPEASDAEERTLDPVARALVVKALAILDQRSPIVVDPAPAPAPAAATPAPAVGGGFALELFEALDAGSSPTPVAATPPPDGLSSLSRAGRRAVRRTVRRTEKRQRKAAKLLERSAALTSSSGDARRP